MIALIDTIFGPVLDWLLTIQQYLLSAVVPSSYTLSFGNIFSPLAMISPAWAALITNTVVMVVAYAIIYVVVNGAGLLSTFKDLIKWW